jgi:hypothetical protein
MRMLEKCLNIAVLDKPEGKTQRGRPMLRWEGNVELDLK